MPISKPQLATCSKCRTETAVVYTYWPATRWEPPDGELKPEECPECGEPFDDNTAYADDEPPEPDHHERWEYDEP
jgi:hypothetical protein